LSNETKELAILLKHMTGTSSIDEAIKAAIMEKLVGESLNTLDGVGAGQAAKIFFTFNEMFMRFLNALDMYMQIRERQLEKMVLGSMQRSIELSNMMNQATRSTFDEWFQRSLDLLIKVSQPTQQQPAQEQQQQQEQLTQLVEEIRHGFERLERSIGERLSSVTRTMSTVISEIQQAIAQEQQKRLEIIKKEEEESIFRKLLGPRVGELVEKALSDVIEQVTKSLVYKLSGQEKQVSDRLSKSLDEIFK